MVSSFFLAVVPIQKENYLHLVVSSFAIIYLPLYMESPHLTPSAKLHRLKPLLRTRLVPVWAGVKLGHQRPHFYWKMHELGGKSSLAFRFKHALTELLAIKSPTKHCFACELSKCNLKVTDSQRTQNPEISVVWQGHMACLTEAVCNTQNLHTIPYLTENSTSFCWFWLGWS